MPENLKNVLLFMSSSGYLVPPSKDPSQEKLWAETWKRIDRFLPDLRKDLSLEDEEEEAMALEKSVAKSEAVTGEQVPVPTGLEAEQTEKAAGEE